VDFVPASVDADSLARYVGLMRICFPGTRKFSPDYMRWLYADNPDGRVIGFDAFEGGELVAHYACIPATARLEGVPVRVMLSLNTATHPRFQGKGLFTQLAERTYEVGAGAGMAAVYGVANANSTPGFTRKLGFQLVAPLHARIGVGALLRNGAVGAPAAFERSRSIAALQWRSTSPWSSLHWRVDGDTAQCFAPAVRGLVSAYDEFPAAMAQGLRASVARPAPLRLFLGLVPQGELSALYAGIPSRLRPSPLNLIYKPLATTVQCIATEGARISFIDFDAY